MDDCGDCRFWKRATAGEIGDCRRRSPQIRESLLAARLRNPEGLSSDAFDDATHFPVTFIEDWCGEYEISDHAKNARLLAVRDQQEAYNLDEAYAKAMRPLAQPDDQPW